MHSTRRSLHASQAGSFFRFLLDCRSAGGGEAEVEPDAGVRAAKLGSRAVEVEAEMVAGASEDGDGTAALAARVGECAAGMAG